MKVVETEGDGARRDGCEFKGEGAEAKTQRPIWNGKQVHLLPLLSQVISVLCKCLGR